MQDLKIHLIINPECELIASDHTVYHNLKYDDTEYVEDITNHVSIEFLLDSKNNLVQNSLIIKQNKRSRQELIDGNISVFHFDYDGVFTYYKYLIPKLDHMLKTNEDGEFYKTSNQLFYYNGHVYFASDDYDNFDEIIQNSKLISDFSEL